MRILAWNCAMALQKKAHVFAELRPDIAVISECAEKSVLLLDKLGYTGTWTGLNPNKGLGLFVRKPLQIRRLPPPKQKWLLAADIEGYSEPLRVIGVWACKVGNNKRENYIGQVYSALRENPDWLSCRNTIVAGDFNSNSFWDFERAVGNHSTVVKMLGARGIVSAYHTFCGEPQGSESRHTSYLLKNASRPFHIDYVFIPATWAKRLDDVSIHDDEKWAVLSDHRPVVVDVRSAEN